MTFLRQNVALVFIYGRRWEIHLPFLKDYFNHMVLHQVSKHQNFLLVFSNHLIPDTSYLDTVSCIFSVKIETKKTNKQTQVFNYLLLLERETQANIYFISYLFFLPLNKLNPKSHSHQTKSASSLCFLDHLKCQS